MARLLFSDFASSLLAASIDATDVSVQVEAGLGALFPTPGAGQGFYIVLENASGDKEVCFCTARTGDLLTVTRAQGGTSAEEWTAGLTRVELRLVASVMTSLIQRTGDAMAGDLDLSSFALLNAVITAPVVNGGQLVGTAIRGELDDTSNEIAVPPDGDPPTIGGSPIVTAANVGANLPVGTILMWNGLLANIPAGFQLCDGTGGTPDLRGAFPRGAGGAVALGATGGAASANTSTGGSHNHGGSTGSHALTAAQMPSHSHRVFASTSGASAGAHGLAASQGRTVAGYPGTGGTETYVTNVGGGASSQVLENTGDGDAHSHSVATLPPYVGIYFIQKVS
jgi:microcystin-dependent protein